MADEDVQAAQPVQANPQGGQKTNVMAILSLIFAIIPGTQLLGLIFGIIALVQIGKDKSQKGKGLAIAGIIVSVLGMLVFLSFIGALAYFGVMAPSTFTPTG